MKEVLNWISSLDDGKYMNEISQHFISNEIDGNDLQDINESHLKEFGITKFGHRLSILKHIKKLKNYKSEQTEGYKDYSKYI